MSEAYDSMGKHLIPERTGADVQPVEVYMQGLSYIASGWQDGLTAFSRYASEFLVPLMRAGDIFRSVEAEKLLQHRSPGGTLENYADLGLYNLDLYQRALQGVMTAFGEFLRMEGGKTAQAMAQLLFEGDWSGIQAQLKRQSELMEVLARRYPEAVQAIEPEFGFHFERGQDIRVAETDRFILYQVLSRDPAITPRPKGKPVLILPPYVLGANILGFLPGEKRSYAHSFADQGIPTYIRVLKDIRTSEAIQTMTPEDDARDTRRFAEAIRKRHGRALTLNGYCQGGFSGLCNILSGELDGLVDAFITCVSPIDGSCSDGLASFLSSVPRRFRELDYSAKTLPNGNKVVDGHLMGWVYKLKSIEDESPIAAFYRDLMMFARQKPPGYKISKTAAALNFWLNHERFDLPLEITRMSFLSYNRPIAPDGEMPVRLFGRRLNIRRLQAKQIPWLICYGLDDKLVEPKTALAPLAHVPAEVSAFPKGHVAIATSWSDPRSEHALHTRFGEHGQYRGPVRFQMDLSPP
jgi:hypothetical protein